MKDDIVTFSIKALPKAANDAILSLLPNGRGREAWSTRLLCIHALGEHQALAVLHIEQIAKRNAERRGESMRPEQSIKVQLFRKVNRFHEMRAFFMQDKASREDMIRRLCAVLYYVGYGFLQDLDIATFQALSKEYCVLAGLPEDEAWECTWRVYDYISGLPAGWRSEHKEESDEREKEIIREVLRQF